MYLLHSVKPGTLKHVIHSNGMIPLYSSYSKRPGVWFSALPELNNRINAVDNIWKENIMFYNRGPVLVFKDHLFSDHKFDITSMEKGGGKQNISEDILPKKIDEFYNHTSNSVAGLPSNRWFNSHETVTNEFVPLTRLHCMLVYKDSHYHDVSESIKRGVIDRVYCIDISSNPLTFKDLYTYIHPHPCGYSSLAVRINPKPKSAKTDSDGTYCCSFSNRNSSCRVFCKREGE